MSYANDITQKVELAAKTFLASQDLENIAETGIFTGINNEDLPLPHVVCVCKRADAAEEIFEGNWHADLILRVVSSAHDDTSATHRDRAAEIFAYFMTATVAHDLSSALDEFTAFFVYPKSQEWDLAVTDNSNYWMSELRLFVKCCGSDIA